MVADRGVCGQAREVSYGHEFQETPELRFRMRRVAAKIWPCRLDIKSNWRVLLLFVGNQRGGDVPFLCLHIPVRRRNMSCQVVFQAVAYVSIIVVIHH